MEVVSLQQRKIHQNKVTSDSSFKATICHSTAKASPLPLTCKEVYTLIPFVIYMKRNFYLLDAINEQIERLKASGLINYWYQKISEKKQKSFSMIQVPKVLGMQSVFGSFQILFGGYVLSVFVFVIEIFLRLLLSISIFS
jgi:hypothetical protein